MENDNSSKIHYENLLQLIDTSWTYVSAPNRRKLNEQKDHVVEMPITNDIKLFLHYVSIEISQKITEFDQNENDYVLFHDFTKLNKLVLAYIIVFNRRREGRYHNLNLNNILISLIMMIMKQKSVRKHYLPLRRF